MSTGTTALVSQAFSFGFNEKLQERWRKDCIEQGTAVWSLDPFNIVSSEPASSQSHLTSVLRFQSSLLWILPSNMLFPEKEINYCSNSSKLANPPPALQPSKALRVMLWLVIIPISGPVLLTLKLTQLWQSSLRKNINNIHNIRYKVQYLLNMKIEVEQITN